MNMKIKELVDEMFDLDEDNELIVYLNGVPVEYRLEHDDEGSHMYIATPTPKAVTRESGMSTKTVYAN